MYRLRTVGIGLITRRAVVQRWAPARRAITSIRTHAEPEYQLLCENDWLFREPRPTKGRSISDRTFAPLRLCVRFSLLPDLG